MFMRGALAEAVHHARERRVFGKMLIEQPQMVRVLADMALDVAAATVLSFRLAEAFDRRTGQAALEADAAWARVMTPVTKYWVCKMAPGLTYEAMECLGGNGYVEDGRLARAYREAPVNAIWEGSGNVMALDLARILQRDPQAFDTVIATIETDMAETAGGTPGVLRAAMSMALADEGACRLLAEQLALAGASASMRRLGLDRPPTRSPRHGSAVSSAIPTACSTCATIRGRSSRIFIRRSAEPGTPVLATET